MDAMLFAIRKRFSDCCHISTDTLWEWLRNEKIVLLDVREEDEFKVSHLHEAQIVSPNLTRDQVKELLQNMHLNEPTKIVCYCSIGYRSSTLVRTIIDLNRELPKNYMQVYNLEGSIFKWANEKRPMVDMHGTPTKYVHPYNSMFAKLVNKDLRKYDF